MIEINLIPDVKRELLRARAIRNTVIFMSVVTGIAISGVALVLGLVYGGQLILENVQASDIKKRGNGLTSIEEINKIVTIQNQLKTIDSQQSNKRINSRLFSVVNAINPPEPNNIKISNIKLDPSEKTIEIEGSAANGYIALEVFKKTITNTVVQAIVDGEEAKSSLATDILAGETGFGEDAEGRKVLGFSFKFTYPDELFSVSKDPVSIITPQGKVDVTDSKLGVPESLFGKKPSDESTKEGGE